MAQVMKVENGVPVGNPIQVSRRHDRSPNIFWKKEQLEKHGYYPAPTDHNRDKETIDIENPTFDGEKVVFQKTPIPQENVKKGAKRRFLEAVRTAGRNDIHEKYDTDTRIDAALGVLPPGETGQIKDDINAIRAFFKAVKTYVDTLATPEAIQALQIDIEGKRIYTVNPTTQEETNVVGGE